MRRWSWLLPLSLGLAVYAVWQGALHWGWVSPFVLPPPDKVVWRLFLEREVVALAAARTFGAALLGLVLAVGSGFLLALLLVVSRWTRAALHPYVLALQMTPIIVVIPIAGIWFGSGFWPIVFVTTLLGFFPVVAALVSGMEGVDEGLWKLFKASGANRVQEFMWLRIPAAMPEFLTGVRIAATLAPVGAITGDFLLGSSSQAGLGFLILVFRSRGETDALFGVALLTCLLGFLFVGSVSLLRWRVLRKWHSSYRRERRA